MTTLPALKKPEPLPLPKIKYNIGTEEVLPFPELDVFKRYDFVNFLCEGRTPEIVMLCTERNREWLKEITFDTYLQLARYFINRNFSMAMEIATHDPIMGLKVGPLLMRMGSVLSLIPSPDSAATPASVSGSGSSSPTTPASSVSAAPILPPAAETPPAPSAGS